MFNRIRVFCFILSFVFSVIFTVKNYHLSNPENLRLSESYKIQKMNTYPPKAFRLANIIENRPEFYIYFRFEKNFTEVFNFSKLYSNYWELTLLIISLVYIFGLFLSKPGSAILVSLPPLIALSFYSASKEFVFLLFLPTIFLSLFNKYVK